MSTLLGPKVSYVSMLDASLTIKAEREAEKPMDKMPLRPSSAGQCARRLAYEFNDFRKGTRTFAEVKDPKTMRLLDFGNNVEYHIIRQFQQMDLASVRECMPELTDLQAFRVAYKQQVVDFFEVAPGERVEGSIDMVFLSSLGKGILDAKSKKDKFWEKWKSDWDKTDLKLENMASVERFEDNAFWINDLEEFLNELEDPFLGDNFYQLNGYACTEFVRQRGIDHGAILQYNKNDSRMREIRFRPSQAVADFVQAKFQAVRDSVDIHGDPEAVARFTDDKESFRCKYCPWKKPCWKKAKVAVE